MNRDDDEKKRFNGTYLGMPQHAQTQPQLPSPNQIGQGIRSGLDKAGNFVDRNITQPLINTNQAIGSAVASGTKDFFRGLGNLPPAQAAAATQEGKTAGTPASANRIGDNEPLSPVTIDLNGQNRTFINPARAQEARAALPTVTALASPTLSPAAPTAPTAPQLPRPGANEAAVNVIRGTQQYEATPGRGERLVGISDPRLNEILTYRDSAIRNRPRNVYSPGSVPSQNDYLRSVDNAVSGALNFSLGQENNAMERAKLAQQSAQEANQPFKVQGEDGKGVYVRKADAIGKPSLPSPNDALKGRFTFGNTSILIGEGDDAREVYPMTDTATGNIRFINPAQQAQQGLTKPTQPGTINRILAYFQERFGRPEANHEDPQFRQFLLENGIDPDG